MRLQGEGEKQNYSLPHEAEKASEQKEKAGEGCQEGDKQVEEDPESRRRLMG